MIYMRVGTRALPLNGDVIEKEEVMSTARYVTLGVLVSLALTLVAAAFADTALVVGVNKYPGLREGNESHDLNGCVNDAQSVAEALKKCGFDNLITLYDADATKENIINTLQKLKLAPTDRFAFYFAGHGTTCVNGESCLLTNKSSFDSEANDVLAKDLYEAVSALHCRSRTVMMDSCFSGGMMRSLIRDKGIRMMKSRGYVRRGLTPAVPTANGDGGKGISDMAAPRATAAICYLAAAKANEQALEDQFGAQVHGVFTQYLLTEMAKGDQQTCGAVHAAIGQQVEERTDRLQHPLLSPGYNDQLLFGGPRMTTTGDPAQTSTTKLPPPPEKKILDFYYNTNADPAQVKVELDPNITSLVVNKDMFSLTATVGDQGGYLVILERGTSGNVNLKFPSDPELTVESARVDAHQKVSLPGPDKKFACDAVGHEYVKAILFRDAIGVKTLLDLFRKSREIDVDHVSRDIVIVNRLPLFTADIVFEVVDK